MAKVRKARARISVVALCLAVFPFFGLFAQERLVIGGKAVFMLADAVYLFPEAGRRVAAVAGADQGLGVFLAAVDRDFPKKPLIDRSAGAEAYAALRPDAVILKTSMKQSLGSSLSALGIRQVYLNLETPEDYRADIKTLGDFLGAPERAEEINNYYASVLAEVARTLNKNQGTGSGPEGKPRVLLVQAANPAEGVWEVPPASWMQTRLVELSGGIPVWTGANLGSGWAKVNAEQIAVWNPDIVFVVNYRSDAKAAAALFSAARALASVAAVKKGRVFGFAQDFYSWDQPDTRWILGLQWMAHRLYPSAFAGRSMEDAAREFFSSMYGMDRAAFDAVIRPRLGGDFAG